MSMPQSVFPQQDADPRVLVRTMQIISGALMLGLLVFAGIATVIVLDKKPQAAFPLIALFAAGFAGINFLARMIVTGQVVKNAIRQMSALRPASEFQKTDLYSIYQVRLIVRAALLEGAGLFNLVAYMIDGQYWSLAITAVLLSLMALDFPTTERVDAWAEDQLRQLQSAQL